MILILTLLFVVSIKAEFIVNVPSPVSNYDGLNYSANGLFDININNQVDSIIDQVRVFLTENGFDPTNLPNHDQEFAVKGIFTHHGKLNLKKGWMQDIRTIRRSDDSTLRIKPIMKAHIKVPIIIPNIEFGYDYKVKFDISRRSGGIIGSVEHYRLFVYAVYDVVRKKIKFNQFDTIDIGKITVKLTGKVWTDWWMNAFINSVTETIHDDIVKVVNSTLSTVADKIVEMVNKQHYNVYPNHFIPLYDFNAK